MRVSRSFRLPPELWARLDAEAVKQDRSRTQVLKRVLESALVDVVPTPGPDTPPVVKAEPTPKPAKIPDRFARTFSPQPKGK